LLADEEDSYSVLNNVKGMTPGGDVGCPEYCGFTDYFLCGYYLTSLLFASSIFGATYITIAVLGIRMQEFNTYSAYKSQKIDRNFPTGTKDTTLSLLSLAHFSASMNISGTN